MKSAKNTPPSSPSSEIGVRHRYRRHCYRHWRGSRARSAPHIDRNLGGLHRPGRDPPENPAHRPVEILDQAIASRSPNGSICTNGTACDCEHRTVPGCRRRNLRPKKGIQRQAAKPPSRKGRIAFASSRPCVFALKLAPKLPPASFVGRGQVLSALRASCPNRAPEGRIEK
jgi:hypothetical protein